MRTAYSISARRACGLTGLARSLNYYKPKRNPMNDALAKRIKELAASRIRFGFQRIHILLRREGWKVNRKRVHRLYRLEGLQLRRKKVKKRISHSRVQRDKAVKADERWSMDFVTDRFEHGSYFRILTVVDQHTRECLALKAGQSMRGVDVARHLKGIAKRGRVPKSITVDNGSEFYSEAMDRWAYNHGVELDFIRPGRPVDNHYIESFNGKLRDECLNTNLFYDITDAQAKLDAWRDDYNQVRPHSALSEQTPMEFAMHQKHKTKRAEIALKI